MKKIKESIKKNTSLVQIHLGSFEKEEDFNEIEKILQRNFELQNKWNKYWNSQNQLYTSQNALKMTNPFSDSNKFKKNEQRRNPKKKSKNRETKRPI